MTINTTPVSDPIAIHRGAPKPFSFRQLVNGVYRAFDNTVTCRVSLPNGNTFDLIVGSGITLGTWNAVANALVTIKLTAAQSRLIPVGTFAGFEVQENVTPNETIIFMGRLNGVGGDNTGD